MSKIKVCFFVNSMFKCGGEQRIVTMLANYLTNNHYEVTILIKNKEAINLALYNLSPNIKLVFLKNNYAFRLNNIKFFEWLRKVNRKRGLFKNNAPLIRHFFISNYLLKQLKTFFKDYQFDYVIGVAGDRSFILSYLHDVIKAKIIFWNQQAIKAHFKEPGSRYFNEEIFIKPLFNNFYKIVILNQYDQLLFNKLYHLKAIYLPNCNSFKNVECSKLNNNRFLAVGRLCNQKGFDLLIKAMKIFCEKNNTFGLDIYGEGRDYHQLKWLIKKYHLTSKIKIIKPQSNLATLYKNYDVFLLSSRYEGFGLVTIEAMQCGLPVIGYDILANKDLIKDQVNGFLVPCYDVKKYAESMLKMVQEKDKLSYYAKKAQLISKNFNSEKILKKWQKFLI